jgi:hypothetical protein
MGAALEHADSKRYMVGDAKNNSNTTVPTGSQTIRMTAKISDGSWCDNGLNEAARRQSSE